VDYVRYADHAARLVNTPLDELEDVEDLLVDRASRVVPPTPKDLATLRRLQPELRCVFEASAAGDEDAVVDRLNALMAKYPVKPVISGHGSTSWHLHVTDETSSVSELLAGEALMGLAFLVCDLGATRLGLCQAAPCGGVFIDTSPNQSRRYCSDRCSSRANVAAYRARQKANHPAGKGLRAAAD
jgi:predicted RNA-binding Zn ribbon-like protein